MNAKVAVGVLLIVMGLAVAIGYSRYVSTKYHGPLSDLAKKRQAIGDNLGKRTPEQEARQKEYDALEKDYARKGISPASLSKESGRITASYFVGGGLIVAGIVLYAIGRRAAGKAPAKA